LEDNPRPDQAVSLQHHRAFDHAAAERNGELVMTKEEKRLVLLSAVFPECLRKKGTISGALVLADKVADLILSKDTIKKGQNVV
jgi:hypothetical protein